MSDVAIASQYLEDRASHFDTIDANAGFEQNPNNIQLIVKKQYLLEPN